MQTMFSVRLPDDVVTRLDDLAKSTGRSKTFYVRKAILDQLENLEDLYTAEQKYIEFRESGEKTIPLDAVIAELNTVETQ